MHFSRRTFMKSCAAGFGAAAMPFHPAMTCCAAAPALERRYHLSAGVEALESSPDLLATAVQAGVHEIWLAAFFYGHWPYSMEKLATWRERIEKAGLAVNIINVPLGHPGDSLGSSSGTFPLTPPERWRMGVRPDGTKYSGTSLHPPGTEENAAATRQLRDAGFQRVFVDDDFRLAQGPGVIGGCYCDEHRRQFCEPRGYGDAQWKELIDAVQGRSLTPLLREWVEFTCDQLTGCFRAQQAAGIDLGIMVMYLGAEKAGIRLADYRDSLFRVGELMFDDDSFGSIKGKTNELFSALFHRRFAQPHLAYSETTAYPADRLSARNMAAKLAVSTIADVRNTMYMSGMTPFPITHWVTLEPAMKRHAELHRRVAGKALRGPLLHYWGEAARYTGNDDPYSLFLAMGIPFQVAGDTPSEGYAFLSDADAIVPPRDTAATLVARKAGNGLRAVPETLDALFALKHELLPTLGATPYVEQDIPTVCAWYPEAGGVLLWNLVDARQTLTLVRAHIRREVEIDALDAAFVEI